MTPVHPQRSPKNTTAKSSLLLVHRRICVVAMLACGVLAILGRYTLENNNNNNHKEEADRLLTNQAAAITTKHQSKTVQLPSSFEAATTTKRTTTSATEPVVPHSASSVVIPVEPTDFIYQNVWNSPIVIERFKLVYIEVPKVGTTNWKKLFRRMMTGKNSSDWKTRDPHNANDNGLQYLCQYKNRTHATEIMNSPEYTRVMFVRDPKERVLSAFINKVLQDTPYIRRVIFEQTQYCSQHDAECLAQFQTFEGFLTAIRKCSKRFCEDGHWMPQSSRLDAKFFSKLDFVGHLETAERDAKRLLQKIGAWEEYGRSGWGKYGNESFLQTKSDVGHVTNAGDQRAKFFNPMLELLVEQVYAADYALLNLSKNPVAYS